jgi:hypothetical protein
MYLFIIEKCFVLQSDWAKKFILLLLSYFPIHPDAP